MTDFNEFDPKEIQKTLINLINYNLKESIQRNNSDVLKKNKRTRSNSEPNSFELFRISSEIARILYSCGIVDRTVSSVKIMDSLIILYQTNKKEVIPLKDFFKILYRNKIIPQRILLMIPNIDFLF